MPIETICSGCAKKLRVGDEHAGKQARCPQCGAIYTVPNAVDPPRSAFDDLGAPLSQRASSQPPERWLMKIDDGREFGPVERPALDQWYAERRIGPTTQIRRETDAQWQPASHFFPSLASAPAAPATFTPAANPFAEQSPYRQFSPTGAPAAMSYREPHRGGLILALSLIGWFVGCFFLGTISWVLGQADLSKMRAGQMDPGGEGLTRAGMIIGIIHTVLSILVILMVIVLMIIGAAAGN